MTTQERIIDSAAALFSRKGYKNTSIKEIARRAQVNSLTIFRNFHDKDTLFLRAVDHLKSRRFDPQALDDSLSFRDVTADIMLIGKAYIDEIYASIPLIRIYIGESLNFNTLREERWFISPTLREHFRAYVLALDNACPLARENVELLSDLFVAYITRKAMPSRTEGDARADREMSAEYWRREMEPQLVFMAELITGAVQAPRS